MNSPLHIRDRAAEWVIRSEAAGFPDREEFEAWCAADPAHLQAFENARSLWHALGDHAGVTPASALPQAPRRLRSFAQRQVLVGAIAASIVIAVGIGLSDDVMLRLQSDFQSGVQSHRLETLTDGSRIELDSASAVALDFDEHERRIVLLRGQVFVEASPVDRQEKRPFVVVAANGRTRALGTSFNVNLLPGEVDVTVVTHRIAVISGPGDTDKTAAVLSPGQAARYFADGTVRREEAVPALATAWRQGRIILDRVSLAQACTILQRYSNSPLRLWTRGGAMRTQEMLISGVFDAQDVRGTLDLIAREHGLQVRRVPLLGLIITG